MAGCGGYYYSLRLGAATLPLAPQSSNNPSSNGFQTSTPLSATPGAASHSQQENPGNPRRAAGQFPWLPAPSPEQNNGVPAYRRHLAAAPEPCAKVRAEGRKIVASPRRAPAPPAGIKMFPAARAHEAGLSSACLSSSRFLEERLLHCIGQANMGQASPLSGAPPAKVWAI